MLFELSYNNNFTRKKQRQMQQLLKQLQEQRNWKQFMKKACRRNKISVDIASYFTPNKIRGFYQRFYKIYQTKAQPDSICWLQNQLKSFHWILIALSGLKDHLIQDFIQDQWKIMRIIFVNKQQSTLEYQAIKLVNQRVNKNHSWTTNQTQLLGQIIKQNQNSNRWNDIARKLFQKSKHQFFRSGKQCRQRWLNHLDPCKKRGQWQQEQDKLIVSCIFNYGRRWSNIAKQLGKQRTQHMVKNRYKTLIIKQRKITPKITNQNSLLRQIAKKLIGQNFISTKNTLPAVKQQDEQQEQGNNSSDMIQQKKKYKNSEKIFTPKINQYRNQKLSNFNELFEIKQQKIKYQQNKQSLLFRDPIISQVIQDYAKAMQTASTPIANYQLQQIYSPFYINYQAITPYLSPSPTIPFFMNSTFSAFDNAFTNNLFIKNTNMHEKKEDNS